MVHSSIQLPDSESRSPFSRPDRKHARHATATDPPRETRSGSFSDVRTVRKNVSPADSARRTQTPEGRSRTAGHTQPKGWRSPAAGRNDDNGPPCTAGRIRQERQGTRPTETKNRPTRDGHTKIGTFPFHMRRIVECPILFVFGRGSERAHGRKHRTGCASIERLGLETRFGNGSHDSLRGLVDIDRQQLRRRGKVDRPLFWLGHFVQLFAGLGDASSALGVGLESLFHRIIV